jgi:hypothetical protein
MNRSDTRAHNHCEQLFDEDHIPGCLSFLLSLESIDQSYLFLFNVYPS